ncbi:hypothetical protein [Caulobacter sp. UC70_42]|uniref:hypothetical protein n=1 Tax=Caulobacter sp. UC70_42 TaxID=3374551 RepID=UPI003757AE72
MAEFINRRAFDRDTGNRYYVNGRDVGYSNYEEHGSDGMSLADDLFASIARAVGADLKIEDVPNHDDA